jgi:hypothetical protein
VSVTSKDIHVTSSSNNLHASAHTLDDADVTMELEPGSGNDSEVVAVRKFRSNTSRGRCESAEGDRDRWEGLLETSTPLNEHQVPQGECVLAHVHDNNILSARSDEDLPSSVVSWVSSQLEYSETETEDGSCAGDSARVGEADESYDLDDHRADGCGYASVTMSRTSSACTVGEVNLQLVSMGNRAKQALICDDDDDVSELGEGECAEESAMPATSERTEARAHDSWGHVSFGASASDGEADVTDHASSPDAPTLSTSMHMHAQSTGADWDDPFAGLPCAAGIEPDPEAVVLGSSDDPVVRLQRAKTTYASAAPCLGPCLGLELCEEESGPCAEFTGIEEHNDSHVCVRASELTSPCGAACGAASVSESAEGLDGSHTGASTIMTRTTSIVTEASTRSNDVTTPELPPTPDYHGMS